jgi:hypothetical protein
MLLVAFGVPGDHAFEHVGEPGHRLDALELRRPDPCHCNRPPTRSAIGIGKMCVLSAQSYRSGGALDHLGVHLDVAIVEGHDQPGPLPDRITDRLRQIGDSGDAPEAIMQPRMQGFHIGAGKNAR